MINKLLLTVVLLTSAAFCSTVELRQDGWSDGAGPLYVSFEGVDLDSNGHLVTSELTGFRATWRTPGGTLTGWGLGEIEPEGFKFTNVGDFLFFVSNPEYSMVNTAFEGEALATVFNSLLSPVSSTAVAAEAVPEPATVALTATALCVIFIRTSRRRRREGAERSGASPIRQAR